MIFFTSHVTIIRRDHDRIEKRQGSPAQVEDGIIRLPRGTDVHSGDHLEYRLATDELRRMAVLDVVYPHTSSSCHDDDHIEVTCVPLDRVALPRLAASALHPALSGAAQLAEDGRMSEAVHEALRLLEERVQSLTASEHSGQALMESVFGAIPPRLDITTTTGQRAHDEREGFRHLFIGAVLGLGPRYDDDSGRSTASAEARERLALASMLMRRLDRAESRLR